VLLASSTSLIEEAELQRSGFSALLTKPVRYRNLHDCLLRCASLKPQVNAATPPKPSGGPQKGKILLVEDNLINQKVAIGLLQHLNCEVQVAHNGKEGVEMFANGDFDLILMDCMMPVMDGYAATAAIRAKQADGAKPTPIVALTANNISGDREKCLAAGMDDYLAKPYSMHQLQAILQRWLTPADASQASAAENPHATR
jgi:CheY-like chemotaxis protein